MKIELTVKKEFEVMYLQAECGVRYWEDALVNGVEDLKGALIPCKQGDNWCPLIAIETGVILNWVTGRTAKIHYKVCDDGTYRLLDENKEVVKEFDGYVPTIMCPKGNGYGDYVIMEVDENGKISNWKIDLEEFTNTEEDEY